MWNGANMAHRLTSVATIAGLLHLLAYVVAGSEVCRDISTWCEESANSTACQGFPVTENLRRNCMKTCGICDTQDGKFVCTTGYYETNHTCRQCANTPEDQDSCSTPCPQEKFGVKCDQTCGHCKASTCLRWTGECPEGCQTDWVGIECKGLDPEGSLCVSSNMVITYITCATGATIVITAVAIFICFALKRRSLHLNSRRRKDFSRLPTPSELIPATEEEATVYDTPQVLRPRFLNLMASPRPHVFHGLTSGQHPHLQRSVSVDNLSYCVCSTVVASPQDLESASSDLGSFGGSQDFSELNPDAQVFALPRRAPREGERKRDYMRVATSPFVTYVSRRAPRDNTQSWREYMRTERSPVVVYVDKEKKREYMLVETSPLVQYTSWRAGRQVADRNCLQLGCIRSRAGYMDMSGTVSLRWRLYRADEARQDRDKGENCEGGCSNDDSGIDCYTPEPRQGLFNPPSTFEFGGEVLLPRRSARKKKVCTII